MLTPAGLVKVLDFGLAKAFSTDPAQATVAQSPALSLAMTQQGLILGTAGYMAPEQASGQPADQRADVWAFGVVVYEMLTGLPLFRGESVPHILADVLKTEPDWQQLPQDLHPRLKQMLARCLTKRPRNRYAGIADARVDIEAVLSDPAGVTPRPQADAGTPLPPWQRYGAALGLLAVGVAIAAIAGWALQPDPEPRLPTAFREVIGSDQVLRGAAVRVLALAPDGRRIAYNTQDGFRLRELGEIETRLISGTGNNAVFPFFSADSSTLAYFQTQPERAIRRIGIQGGASVAVSPSQLGAVRGASWGPDGNIYFASDGGISRIAGTGGSPELIAAAADNERMFSPSLLPDGDSLLFDVDAGNRGEARIVVQSLATGQRRTLVEGGSNPLYVPTGHLVYAFEDVLYGMAFDLETQTISGGPVTLRQGIMRSSGNQDANYGISANGTLAYLSGRAGARTIVWVDREGQETPINVPPRLYNYVQLSPDGTRLALDARDEETDIWIFDLERETPQRLTFDPGLNRGPLWSPTDGQRVLFTRALEDGEEIYWQAADGSGVPEALTQDSGRPIFPSDITPDGKTLIFTDVTSPRDIWQLPLGEPGAAAEALIATPANEFSAQVSPNGRFLVYQSDESGQPEIYVRPYPEVDTGRWQVSRGGGTRPRWSRDGSELFFFATVPGTDSSLMVSTITADTTFRWSVPQALFSGSYTTAPELRQSYDVSLDGQSFLMIKDVAGENGAAPEIIVIENWFEELKRLVPN
jgi:serine/threonine-protein kinase